MLIKYIGPFDAVDVPLPLGGTITAKHGEEINIFDSVAEELLKQKTNWEKANKKGGSK